MFSRYSFKYSVNTWWDLSIQPLLCGWYADVMYCLLRNLFATFFINEDVKFASWSVRMALGDPDRQINRLTKTSTISTEEIPSIGIPIEYLVNKSWIDSMYLIPFCVFGNRPTIYPCWSCRRLYLVCLWASSLALSLFLLVSLTGILYRFLHILEFPFSQ